MEINDFVIDDVTCHSQKSSIQFQSLTDKTNFQLNRFKLYFLQDKNKIK